MRSSMQSGRGVTLLRGLAAMGSVILMPAATAHCGATGSAGLGPPDAGFRAGDDGSASSTVATTPTKGTSDGGPTGTCHASSDACTIGFDCCSGTCTGGTCVGAPAIASPAGAPPTTTTAPDGAVVTTGVCIVPGASCTQSPQCCSGLCEPVTGQAGVVQCRDACRADGVACSTAQDCCSLGCFGGVCTSQLCTIIGDPCTDDSACCSGVCNAQTKQCDVDLANSTCRPTGEDCGKGPQSGCCGATKDDDLCDPQGRCGLPPGACRGQKASCTADSDCCSQHCDPASKTCTTVCTAAAGACTIGSDCCASSCTNGVCDAPPSPTSQVDASPGVLTASDAGAVDATPPATCAPIGTSCTTGATCCTGLCLGGFCDRPPA